VAVVIGISLTYKQNGLKSPGPAMKKPFKGLKMKTVVSIGTVFLTAFSMQAQNLFEADAASGNIYEFTPGGGQSTFVSGLNGQLDDAQLAFDSAGDLFVTSFFGNSITEFTPGGGQSPFASGLNEPIGLAIDSADNLFVTSFAGNSITKIAPGGAQSPFASGLGGPHGLAFNSAGVLFEADGSSGNIYEFTPGGGQSIFTSGLGGSWGLAFNSAGDLFVSEPGPNGSSIIKITPGGVQSTFFSINTYDVWSLAFNSAGDLFASISPANNFGYNGKIIEIAPDGTASTFASSLNSPEGIAFQGVTLPVPEPTSLGLLAVGAAVLFVRRRKLAAWHAGRINCGWPRRWMRWPVKWPWCLSATTVPSGKSCPSSDEIMKHRLEISYITMSMTPTSSHCESSILGSKRPRSTDDIVTVPYLSARENSRPAKSGGAGAGIFSSSGRGSAHYSGGEVFEPTHVGCYSTC